MTVVRLLSSVVAEENMTLILLDVKCSTPSVRYCNALCEEMTTSKFHDETHCMEVAGPWGS